MREVDELREWWVRYPERYSPQGKAPARTWYIPIPRQGSWGNNWVRHFNPLPPELVERILLLTTDKGDVVFDPFSGSGAGLAQAHVLGRSFIGLDLNRSYKRMFERRVLAAFRSRHNDNAERGEQRVNKKRKFNKLIRSLRKTKYPKELMRLYTKAHSSLKLKCLLVLQGSTPECVDIILLFPSHYRVPRELIPRMEKLSRRPPLSKYGITMNLTAFSLDEVSRGWLKRKRLTLDKRLFLYANGRTYAWAEKITVAEWEHQIKNGGWSGRDKKYPAIISDIGVKVDPNSPLITTEENE